MKNVISKTEKILAILAAGISSSFVFINPYVSLPFLTLFISPSTIFKFNPWYYPIYFLIWIFFIIFYLSTFFDIPIKLRKIGWLTSILFNFAWVLYCALGPDPFFNIWFIWFGNIIIFIISIFALREVGWFQNKKIVLN